MLCTGVCIPELCKSVHNGRCLGASRNDTNAIVLHRVPLFSSPLSKLAVTSAVRTDFDPNKGLKQWCCMLSWKHSCDHTSLAVYI